MILSCKQILIYCSCLFVLASRHCRVSWTCVELFFLLFSFFPPVFVILYFSVPILCLLSFYCLWFLLFLQFSLYPPFCLFLLLVLFFSVFSHLFSLNFLLTNRCEYIFMLITQYSYTIFTIMWSSTRLFILNVISWVKSIKIHI